MYHTKAVSSYTVLIIHSFLFLSVLIICGSYLTIRTIKDFCSKYFSRNVLSLVNILFLSNSTVNAFVCSLRMPIFNEALKKHCRKRRQITELRAASFNACNVI